ncbi:MAG TPA: DUF4136 domain-containing protein [Sphingomicrobium sp.]
MNRISKLGGALLLGAGSIILSGCAATMPTQVTRFQAMPAPSGQTFYVVPADGQAGGIQFGQYATLVAQQLAAKGYQPAGAPQLADMLVKVGYDIEQDVDYRVDTLARSRMYDPFYRRGFYDPWWGVTYGRPYYSRYGYYSRYRDPFYWGYGDPWYYGGSSRRVDGYNQWGEPVRAYKVYESELDMNIVRRADNLSLFEGKAQARSATDELGVIVPNLIEAMFTGFPGRSGETVKITIPARKD